MAKVVGIGGVFLYSDDKEKMLECYAQTLGIEMESWGSVLNVQKTPNKYQVLSIIDGDYFPKNQRTMKNFVVENISEMKETLINKGIEIIKHKENDYGKIFTYKRPRRQ